MDIVLDNRTQTVIQIAISAMLFLVMLVTSKSQKTYPGFLDWTYGKIPNLVGWILVGMMGIVPLWVSAIVGNGLLALPILFIFSGIRKFRGKPARNKLNIFLLILLIFSFYYFALIQPNANARMFLFFIYLLILTGQCTYELLFDVPKEFRLSFWFTASMFFIGMLTSLVRVITIRNLTQAPGPFGIDQVQTMVFLITNVFMIGWTFGFFMMTNQRLIVELQDGESKQHKLATTDYLTGIYNRLEFIARSQTLIALAKRSGRPLGVLLIDLDYFKKINDGYGHSAGDEVLCAFAANCQQQLREIDIFARWGGEEFTALLPETDQMECVLIANRILESTAKLVVITESGPLHITISIGIAIFKPVYDNIFQVLSLADHALYQAKKNGRNRVEISEQVSGEYTHAL
jgi:diguanylate cyclase (GGDEF)-like protein